MKGTTTLALSIGTASGLLISSMREAFAAVSLGATNFSLAQIAAAVIAANVGDFLAECGFGPCVVGFVACLGVSLGWRSGAPLNPATLGTDFFWPLASGFLLGALLRSRNPAPGTTASAGAGPEERLGADERQWIVIPTLNEAGSLRELLPRIRAVCPGVTILVVDDDSHDGTAALVTEMARSDPRIKLHVRYDERGLDGAWRAGFQMALEEGAVAIVSMDGDGSHPPERLPALLEELRNSEVVIGSRYVAGGRTVNWPLNRLLLSRMANHYARYVLHLHLSDCTSGFRGYQAEALRQLLADVPAGCGYALLEVLLFRAARAGLRVSEVPIVYQARRHGESKLHVSEIWKGARLLWKLADSPPGPERSATQGSIAVS